MADVMLTIRPKNVGVGTGSDKRGAAFGCINVSKHGLNRASAKRTDFSGGYVEIFGAASVDDHINTFARERCGAGFAEPARGGADDGFASG